ncbi:conserved hypothetical protein [Xanthomonas citri pv. citri str. 306]|uniref:Uncharacterized protein n=1 Tax=Xanthomonas axonopodis pv. citri (strain 306) TaxID=190486 RepID=A0AAI7ZEK1_XANAC|nr:conserved hypothetical protein [Xanthomonas citri pv. citri str. 306]
MSVVGRLVDSMHGFPHPPFGTFPRGRGEGAGGRPFAVQPTDRAQPDRASPAGGRRWRAAPDEGQSHAPVVVASQRCRPHPPFGHLPPQAGEGSLVRRRRNGGV